MIFAQDMLFEMNFDPVPQPNKWLEWVMRGLGVLGLLVCYLIYQWSQSAADMKRYLPWMTVMYFVFPAAVPWYAQRNLPVKQEHWIPTGGCLLIFLGFFYHYNQSKSKGK
jgi:hypothetical protein